MNVGGYNWFMDNIEILFEKYKVFLLIMNMVYVEELEDVYVVNVYLSLKVKYSNLDRFYIDFEYMDYLRINFFLLEVRKYLFDDLFLKNRMVDYMCVFSSVVDRIIRFRIVVIELYL